MESDGLFTVHKLNDLGMMKARAIEYVFQNALSELSLYCPEGRRFSMCKTKLEEAAFFAKKSMAEDFENHDAH
mgnify:CR=1 FL=1